MGRCETEISEGDYLSLQEGEDSEEYKTANEEQKQKMLDKAEAEVMTRRVCALLILGSVCANESLFIIMEKLRRMSRKSMVVIIRSQRLGACILMTVIQVG